MVTAGMAWAFIVGGLGAITGGSLLLNVGSALVITRASTRLARQYGQRHER